MVAMESHLLFHISSDGRCQISLVFVAFASESCRHLFMQLFPNPRFPVSSGRPSHVNDRVVKLCHSGHQGHSIIALLRCTLKAIPEQAGGEATTNAKPSIQPHKPRVYGHRSKSDAESRTER